MGAVLLCVLIAVVATQATGAVDGWAYQISSQVVAGGSSLLAGLGAWRHRMSLGWVGWLIFLGIATQGVAALWVWVHSFRSDESLFPGPVDALFLFNYVCMGAAALLVVRRRRLVRNTAAMIDAIAATVAFAVLAWCFVIADIADNASVSIAARAVGALYPICDVLVFGAMIRLLFSSSNSRGPVLFLTGGMLCLLAGDVGFTVAVFAATDNEADRWITALYHLSVMLVALSLWQKDTARLVDVQEQAQERLGTIRKLTLSVGALVAPATLVVLHLRGNNEHVLAAAAGGVILSALTLIRMSLLISAVESQSEQLVQLARTDGLTGLANRRTFDFELGRAMREVLDTADGEPPALSIGLLDLDRFKQFNDTHGHSRGDQLLRECAAHWTDALSRLSPAGFMARYGGEEFVVIFRGDDAGTATAILREIMPLTPMQQTFSAGVATWDGNEPALDLINRADQRLYAAKAAGRRLVIGEQSPVNAD